MSLVGLRGAVISTHSAHEDGDYFQTLNTFPMSRISTHSAHEDGDSSRFKSRPNSSYFNPLRPRGRRLEGLKSLFIPSDISTHSAHEDGDRQPCQPLTQSQDFNPLRPRGRRQQYYTKKPTILHHISTIKSHHTPSNHRQPTLHTSKTVLIVQFFRCESPRKFMFASGSHQTI